MVTPSPPRAPKLPMNQDPIPTRTQKMNTLIRANASQNIDSSRNSFKLQERKEMKWRTQPNLKHIKSYSKAK